VKKVVQVSGKIKRLRGNDYQVASGHSIDSRTSTFMDKPN